LTTPKGLLRGDTDIGRAVNEGDVRLEEPPVCFTGDNTTPCCFNGDTMVGDRGDFTAVVSGSGCSGGDDAVSSLGDGVGTVRGRSVF
jgi:hypothetical protein